MQAWVFVIKRRDSRKVTGAALVALEARYVAGCWFGAPRLDRAFATPTQWNEIRHAFSVGLPTTPLPSSDALAAVLLRDKAIDAQIQYLTATDVTIDAPENAVTLLDNLLIRVAGHLQAPTQQVG